MKDFRLVFAYAAVLFAVAFLFRSIAYSYASPTGPNVGIGSNPNVVFYGSGSTNGDRLLETIPSDRVLIITDFDFQNTSTNSGSVYIRDGQGNDIAYFGLGNTQSKHISKNSGIPFGPGTELYINIYGGSIQYNMTGYYTHP